MVTGNNNVYLAAAVLVSIQSVVGHDILLCTQQLNKKMNSKRLLSKKLKTSVGIQTTVQCKFRAVKRGGNAFSS